MNRFISLASHPGKTGTYFYNRFFKAKGLDDHVYQSLACSNIEKMIQHQLSIGDLRGISISMPFKKLVIPMLDATDELVTKHDTCNTVLINNGRMIGYNADHAGAEALLSIVHQGDVVSILGSGSMARMMHSMIERNSTMFSRSLGNWEERHSPANIVINATGAGTSSSESPLDMIPGARLVMDLAMKGDELKKLCLDQGVGYIDGLLFYKHQFMSQFKIYTNIEIDPNEFDEAEKDFRNEHT